MTIKQVVNKMRRHRPANADQMLRRCGVSLRYLDSGAYRHVYQVEDLPLVVKFPYFEDTTVTPADQKLELDKAIAHTGNEISVRRRILRSKKKYVELQAFLPKVYHASRKTGVVAVHKYQAMSDDRSRDRDDSTITEIEIHDVLKGAPWLPEGNDVDIRPGNLGRDDKGNVVILDMGCFESGT